MTTPPTDTNTCWFCNARTNAGCRCGRMFCGAHEFNKSCVVCALGFGYFEEANRPEPVSGLIILSLSVLAKDPYIVIPPHLRDSRALPLNRVEELVGTLLQMVSSTDFHVCRRAAGVLSAATNSWPSMNPSQVSGSNNYGTSLLSVDQVRRRLLSLLKRARSTQAEPIALAILEPLRTADFRDLYPEILQHFSHFTSNNMGGRIGEVFEALLDFYPSSSYAANERCELIVYEQYMNRRRGAGEMMERIWGHRLRYEPNIARLLKKGLWHTDANRFMEWYPGEDEPY
jgi:hypothetical protein